MLEPFYQGYLGTIYDGDALKVLKALPEEIVQMCQTSPPYWGLRNYADGANIVWSDNHCEHEWLESTYEHQIRTGLGLEELGKKYQGGGHKAKEAGEPTIVTQGFCPKCGAWRGQLGLEPTPELYVEHLMMIFREVKRVLKKDGSFYLNIADTYAGSWSDSGHRPERTGIKGHQRNKNTQWLERKGHPQMNTPPTRQCLKLSTIQPKCMVCIPERVLFAMLADSWILRNKIIWHKRNYMPGSQKDRFTQSWEYLYFFTKARKYYFDLDAVRVPHKTQSLERYQRGVNLGRPAEGKSGEVGPMQQYIRAPGWFQEMFPPDEDYKGKFDDLFGHGPNPQSFNLRVRDVKRGKKGTSAQSGELKASEEEVKEYEYPEKHHGSSMTNQESLHKDRAFQSNEEPYLINNPHVMRLKKDEYLALNPEHPNDLSHPKGKNPGDLWSIATKPSSISVCPKCETVFSRLLKICPHCKVEGIVGHFAPYPEALCFGPIKASSRVGDIVLDPFAGGGTTGVAAKRLGRQAILIDCVRPYCIMAKYKLQKIEYQPEIRHSNENV